LAKQDAAAKRQCIHCGKYVPVRSTQCMYCKESLPDLNAVRATVHIPAEGGPKIRRGLLYMLLAGVVQYYAGGYSGITLPVEIDPVVFQYLVPGLFLLGLGLVLYGFYLKMKG
jgi:hypothetical protein